jgi:ABC-type transport system substrate-binding protein
VAQATINASTNKAKNGGGKPWEDIRFREAIYRVTNRDQFVKIALAGNAVIPAGPIPASLEAYQIDPKDAEPYWKQDPQAAKQLLSAMNYDTSKDWEVVISNTTAANATYAEIWQQQLSAIGIKLHVVARPLAEILPKQMQTGAFDFWLGGQPGGDTPYRAMRNQHSDTLDQFNNVGLFDPAIDALIEKSETTTDRDENIKLVKQIQLEALKKYSTSINLWTAQMQRYYNASLQNFEIDPLAGQNFQYNAWFA